MIFYFSGCGNTRWAARQVAAIQKERLVFIPDIVKRKGVFELHDDEKIGFFFPVYAWAPPKIVCDFIGDLNLGNYHGQYLFLILTCGDDVGRTRQVFQKIIERRGWRLDSAFSIRMPNTYVCLPGFHVDRPKRREEKLKQAPDRIRKINDLISKRTRGVYDVIEGVWPRVKTYLIQPFFQRFLVDDRPFWTSAECIGCGLCARICPVGNIESSGDPPTWRHRCTMCLACFHHCPKGVIAYGRRTIGKDQYLHPEG